MGMKIRSPKEVLEENKNRKLEVNTKGDIVEKLNKEYEDLYGGKPMKKKMDFLDLWAWIFLLVAVGVLVLNFLGIL